MNERQTSGKRIAKMDEEGLGSFERQFEAWIKEEVKEVSNAKLPDHVHDAVMARIRTTKQDKPRKA